MEMSKAEYKILLAKMSERDLGQETQLMIYNSTLFSDCKSDYHWKCDYCYDEWVKREGKSPKGYDRAYQSVAKSSGWGSN